MSFPVGVDAPSTGGAPVPQTMRAYGMRGTPTTILIDARGRLRRQVFGVHKDLQLGAELQALLSEAASDGEAGTRPETAGDGCDDEGCAVDDDDE